MATQMTQFKEVITNVNHRQDELAALVNNQHHNQEDGGNQGLYQEISVGLGDIQNKPFVNLHGPPGNLFLRVGNMGQFPPSPRPHLMGNRRDNQGVRNYPE